MASATIGFGVLLILLGLGGYFGTGRVSITALIPAFFGLPILILGLVAGAEGAQRPALWAAVVLCFLGFGGAGRGLPQLARLLSGGTVNRPVAAVMQSLMAILCLGFGIWLIVWLVTN